MPLLTAGMQAKLRVKRSWSILRLSVRQRAVDGIDTCLPTRVMHRGSADASSRRFAGPGRKVRVSRVKVLFGRCVSNVQIGLYSFSVYHPTAESEGFDRDHMRLNGNQIALLSRLAAMNSRVVMVLANRGTTRCHRDAHRRNAAGHPRGPDLMRLLGTSPWTASPPSLAWALTRRPSPAWSTGLRRSHNSGCALANPLIKSPRVGIDGGVG